MGKVYVLQVLTGMEQDVANLIESYELSKIERVHLLKDVFGGPLFPGYIFVEMVLDGDTYRPVLDTPFVVQYLCPVSGVEPITDDESELVNSYCCHSLEPGLPVEITDGSLRGLSGVLSSIKFPRIVVDVDLYGEIVQFDLSIRHVYVPGVVDSLSSDCGIG